MRPRTPNGRCCLAVAEAWIDLVGPRLDDFRRRHRHRPFVLLRDLDDGLRAKPLPLLDVRRVMADLPVQSPLGERVTACIIGVPGVAADGPAAPWSRVAGSR